MNRRSLSAITVVLSIALGACGGQAGSPAGSQAAGGGSLSVGYEGDIASLDPSQGYDYISWEAENLIFETLITYDDGTSLVPQLAEEMPSVSEDGTTYTFALRDGVNFVRPDGTVHREMTADDVAFSLNRLLSPNLTPTPSPVGASFFAIIEGAQEVLDGKAEEATGIRVVDERTIEITIAQADPTFLNVLAMPFGSVIPADVATDDTEAFSAEPVGTGPYILESRTIGESAAFVRNDDYWGTLAPTERIEFRIGLDANTAVQQVEANQLDIMGDPAPTGIIEQLRADYPGRVIEYPQVAVSYLSIDTSDPAGGPLTDVRVRQALNHAIDKDNLVELQNGLAEPVHCIFPPLLPGYDPDCRPYEYDPDRAGELLEEAGFGDGFSTTLYTDTSEISTAIAQAIQQDLAAVEVEVEIVTQEFDVLIGTISVPHEAPLVYIGWFQDFPDPSDFYDPILSCAAAVEGGANSSWFCDEEIDAFAAEAKVETDPEERLEKYRELQEMVMAEAPWVPLFAPLAPIFVSDRVVDFAPHPVWGLDVGNVEVSD